MTPQEIFNVGKVAANIAISGLPDGYPCGFATITIKPARGKFVAFLKEQGIGRTGYYGGYSLFTSEICSTIVQSADIKVAACVAFCTVLKQNGINCSVESRLD